MSRRPQTPEATVEKFRRYLETETDLAEKSIVGYCANINTLIKVFKQHNRHAMPWEIDREDIIWLLDHMKKSNLLISTRKGYIAALRKWTSYYDNNIPSQVKIRWPKDMRPNADWLTQDQAINLLKLPMAPYEELVVHCELCLGMRRIEVLRLTPDSFGGRYVTILGKGSQGGKLRAMPYHRETEKIFKRYMRYRQSLIDLARERRPVTTEVPKGLLIHNKGGVLLQYSKKGSGIDPWLKRIGKEIGYPDLSNHTLRRTFGRTMYKSGIREPVIASMMGHDSIDELIKYLGINGDDMTEAMEAFVL